MKAITKITAIEERILPTAEEVRKEETVNVNELILWLVEIQCRMARLVPSLKEYESRL